MEGDLKSIIIPAFNEEEMIPVIYERIKPFLEPDDELIFVNDGSTDRTRERIEDLAEQDSRVGLVNFSRNFGHQPAVTAGLTYSRGEAVIVMDCDLQDPPELIPELMELFRQGYDVVHCIRRRRKEHLLKKMAYSFFYNLYTRLTDFPTQAQSGDFSLMSRRVVNAIVSMPEQTKFLRGLRAFVGFNQTTLEYERPARYTGEPKYNLRKLIVLALDGLFSFTTLPLRLMSMIGLLTLALSVILGLVILVQKMFMEMTVGTTTTYLLILFFGGLNLLCFGILGEYVGKVFYEAKRRPFYIVESVKNIGRDQDG